MFVLLKSVAWIGHDRDGRRSNTGFACFFAFLCSAREGFFDLNLLKKIKKAGGAKFVIGAESGSQRVLKFLRKDVKISDLINSANL